MQYYLPVLSVTCIVSLLFSLFFVYLLSFSVLLTNAEIVAVFVLFRRYIMFFGDFGGNSHFLSVIFQRRQWYSRTTLSQYQLAVVLSDNFVTVSVAC